MASEAPSSPGAASPVVNQQRARLRRVSSGSYTGQYRYHVSLGSTAVDIPQAENQQIFFEECLRELVLVRYAADKISVIRHAIDGEHTPPQGDPNAKRKPAIECEIPNTGRIDHLAFSPDGFFFAFQRRDDTVEVRNMAEGNTFLVSCRQSSSMKTRILGFFWPNTANLVLVTTFGVELHNVVWVNNAPQTKLVKEHRSNVAWYTYSTPLRVLLVASTARTSELQAFHFGLKINSHSKLLKFDLHHKNDTSAVHKSEVVLTQIYRGIFCIYINYKRNELVLYQITRDMIAPKLTIDLHTSGPVQLSVQDNLIITHNVAQQVSMIFDIKLRPPQDVRIGFPIAAPLPLTPVAPSGDVLTTQLYDADWRFFLPSFVVSESQGKAWKLQLNLRAIAASFSDRSKLVDFLLRRDHSQEILLRTLRSALVERESLSVFASIFDMLNRVLAAHIAQTSAARGTNASEYHGHVDLTTRKTATFWRTFLRNQHELVTPFSTPPRTPNLAQHAEQSEGEEREAFEIVDGSVAPGYVSLSASTDFADNSSVESDADESSAASATPQSARKGDAPLTKAFSEPALRKSGTVEEKSEARTPPPRLPRQPVTRTEGYLVIEQEQMYTNVLLPVEEEGLVDSAYLVAVAVEYIRTLNYQHIVVKSFLYEFIIDQLVRHNRYYQLHQFIQYHVIADSLHVACQLLSLEDFYPPSYQLALDMLKRLGSYDQIVEVLLAKGHVIQAARFATKQKGKAAVELRPQRFLESCKDDPNTFFTLCNHFDRLGLLTDDVAEYKTIYNNLFIEPEKPMKA